MLYRGVRIPCLLGRLRDRVCHKPECCWYELKKPKPKQNNNKPKMTKRQVVIKK